MEIYRTATSNERRFIISDHLGFSHSAVLVTRYTGPSKAGDDLDTFIRNAIHYCIDQHPSLRLVINNPLSKQPQLALLRDIDLDNHLHYVDIPLTGDDEAQRIKCFLNFLHNARLPKAGERPQWSVYVRKIEESDNSFYLAFMHSHAIWDGLGTVAFQETFLRGLNAGTTAPNSKDLDIAEAFKRIPPPLENAGRLTTSWLFFFTIIIQELFPSWVSTLLGCPKEDVSKSWTGPKQGFAAKKSSSDPQTGVEIVLIPKETLSRCIQLCRIHGGRLTGLLNYLCARAVRKSLAARGIHYDNYRIGTAIDLRRVLGKGQGMLANYVSFITENITLADHEDDVITAEEWQWIKHNTNHLAESSSTLVNHPVALLKWVSNLEEWLQGQAGQPADVSLGLSNLGVFNGTPAGEGPDSWRAEDAFISQSGNLTGAPLDVQMLSTKNGSMGISGTWWPGKIGLVDETEFVREVLHDMSLGMENLK